MDFMRSRTASSALDTAELPYAETSRYEAWGKRAFDVIIALLLLPIVLPVAAALCIAVSRGRSPGLFGHERVGKEGKLFRCYKIRTMVPDAEDKLEAFLAENPDARAEWSEKQKLSDDPRVTPIGRFLRRTSLDELPQLWNVLKGEMSFVGPRPVTVDELDRYGNQKHAYLSLRPGITGLWQVSGRADGCYEDRLRLDKLYSTSISFRGDASLMVKTVSVIFFPTGR